MQRHRQLDGYMVLSMPPSQASINSDFVTMLTELPDLFHENPSKIEAVALCSDETSKQDRHIREYLDNIALDLTVEGTCRIETRFNHLDYGLIERLKEDDLVDQELTPRTRASIRIVLGTISSLAGPPPRAGEK